MSLTKKNTDTLFAYSRHRIVENLIGSLEQYSVEYTRQYDSALATDYVLGTAWLDALKGIRVMLNGTVGFAPNADMGRLDRLILNLAISAGFKEEDL